jgi:hypothetical protein
MPEDVIAALKGAVLDESHRALMVGYLLYRVGAASLPAPELVRDGLLYWQATAERFQHTPYGVALADDIREMLNQGT